MRASIVLSVLVVCFYLVSVVESYWFLKHRKGALTAIRASKLKEEAQTSSSKAETSTTSKAGGGIGAAFVNAVMKSPLYFPIVNKARETMVTTAESAGIDWSGKYQLLREKLDAAQIQDSITDIMNENEGVEWPDYYRQKFHGYGEGNLCLDSAIEQEIAGKAVGARNFPEAGAKGEEVLRESYDREIVRLQGSQLLEKQKIVVDFGSGTGTSTRRLAKLFKNAEQVKGIDLSPYMVAVGRFLMADGNLKEGEWVEDLGPSDPRVSLTYGDISSTGLPSGSVDVVSICLVLHELPRAASERVLEEAKRILRPGGTLLIMEMDPEAPGYVKLRSNAMLFSVLRSTEPFLDEYFDFAPSLPSYLDSLGFGSVKISAATGRHFAIAATKKGVADLRPSARERELSDSHLGTTETKV
jgi:ubiquinone/menaquinone biosynthesis C-methylase UbiE